MKKLLLILAIGCAVLTHAHPIFTIRDLQDRPYTVRPVTSSDVGSIHALERAQDGGEFLRSAEPVGDEAPQTNARLMSFVEQYKHERFPDVETLYEDWVVLQEGGEVVAHFQCGEGEATLLVHPDYRSVGIARLSRMEILRNYLLPRVGKQYLKMEFLPSGEDIDLACATTYKEFYEIFPTVWKIDSVPYQGYFGEIAYNNVPSLRSNLALAAAGLMSVFLPTNGHEGFIGFRFPAQANQDARLLEIVQRLADKEQSVRVQARKDLQPLLDDLLPSGQAAAAAQ